MVSAPVESKSLYDINRVLRKTWFIHDVVEKYYTTHNPKCNSDVFELVELAVNMEMFTAPAETASKERILLRCESQ